MKFAKLRGRIREVFHTEAAFALAMGQNKCTISAKLNGISDWTRRDIAKACSLLDIQFAEVGDYFFCE